MARVRYLSMWDDEIRRAWRAHGTFSSDVPAICVSLIISTDTCFVLTGLIYFSHMCNFSLSLLLTNKHVLNLYIPDRSSVRFEPTYKMDASNENFDILVFVYMLVFLLTFLFFSLVFSISFCFICLGYSIENLGCCCHQSKDLRQFNIYKMHSNFYLEF